MGRRSSQHDPSRYSPAFAKALGHEIKVMRTDLGIERRESAERAGISYSYITEIENGNKPPSSSVLEDIASALGMRMSQLIQAAEQRMDTAEREQERSVPYEAQMLQSSPRLLMEELPSTPEQLNLQLRSALPRRYAMRPSLRGPNRNLRAALMELEELLRNMATEDVERLLDYARRLAR
jgi:transcriptional regulator with XRE-family HTH domain